MNLCLDNTDMHMKYNPAGKWFSAGACCRCAKSTVIPFLSLSPHLVFLDFDVAICVSVVLYMTTVTHMSI
mgnify:CR=1 FL=1